MVVVVSGFPSQFHALQFEWAWQHVYRSRFTKAALGVLKGKRGLGRLTNVRRKLIELHMMLNLEPWGSQSLRMSFPSQEFMDLSESLDCVTLPLRIQKRCIPLNEINADEEKTDETVDSNDTCNLFCEPDGKLLSCCHETCSLEAHVSCLARLMTEKNTLRPYAALCPVCANQLLWPQLLSNVPQASQRNSSPIDSDLDVTVVHETISLSSDSNSNEVKYFNSKHDDDEPKVWDVIDLTD